jgi:hypothetical protein
MRVYLSERLRVDAVPDEDSGCGVNLEPPVGGLVGIASDRARVGDARVRSSEGVGGDQDRGSRRVC